MVRVGLYTDCAHLAALTRRAKEALKHLVRSLRLWVQRWLEELPDLHADVRSDVQVDVAAAVLGEELRNAALVASRLAVEDCPEGERVVRRSAGRSAECRR